MALQRLGLSEQHATEPRGPSNALQGAAEALLGPSWEAEEEAALELELGLEGEEALQLLAASGFSLWAPPLGSPPAADAPDTYPAAATAGKVPGLTSGCCFMAAAGLMYTEAWR